ncbi:MAG TPA: glycosyltransferase family 39 protein, partial [Gemmatimonadales bacterium]|nr:glycosyltransferase family 39 protein [Gemmatimonadales bacterium]
EGGMLILVAAAAVRQSRTRQISARVGPSRGPASQQLLLVAIAFVVTLGAAAAAFVSHLRRYPHGEWDAWMNWDLRARMFFRGGEAWQTAFSAALPWSHPDYPVLLSSLVTRTWLYAGGETLAGPALVAGTFTFATAALMAAGLAALRSTSQGLLASVVLLSTPFFILHGTSLYADVPVGFFFLATIVCLALQERSGDAGNRFTTLAGLAAGLAMWTKNEGQLFTLALVAGLLFAGRTGSRWAVSRRQLLAFGAGLLPMLLLAAGFKMAFAPPNDLLSTLDLDRTFARLTDPHRYYLVFRAYGSHIASFGDNGLGSVTAVLTAYLLGLGINRAELGRPWVRAVSLALVLLLAGHFMVFVSMADELPRLLKSSLDRLLLQIWPSALFLYFMVVRAHEEVRPGGLVTGRFDGTGREAAP